MEVADESRQDSTILRHPRDYANLARNMIRMIVNEVAERAGIINPYQLADATQLPYETCRLIWTGKSTRIDLRTMERLCTVLGVVPGQLFDFKPEELPPPDKSNREAKSGKGKERGKR